jgi:folate-binding protein YgfZ
MESDLNIFVLEDEILLDFESGQAERVMRRLERFIIAEDVQVVDVGSAYGLLSVQGPHAKDALNAAGWAGDVPERPYEIRRLSDSALGEAYLACHPRFGSRGFDLFIPIAHVPNVGGRLAESVTFLGGRWCGWQAMETARIEAGLPRFPVDMDETNLAPETGIEQRAISYSKGCYIGQEVIARIRTYGQVAKALRGLRLPDEMTVLPSKGDRLYHEDKEVGYVTSSSRSPRLGGNVALGYVRREVNASGTELRLKETPRDWRVRVVELPLVAAPDELRA